jgi:hypothetical protein
LVARRELAPLRCLNIHKDGQLDEAQFADRLTELV